MEDLKRYSFMMPVELKKQLEQKAADNGQTLSAYLRLILTANVKDNQTKKEPTMLGGRVGDDA